MARIIDSFSQTGRTGNTELMDSPAPKSNGGLIRKIIIIGRPLLIIILCLCSRLYAQEQYIALQLKNGVILNGQVVELTDDQVVLVKADKKSVRLKFDQIQEKSLAVLKAIPKVTRPKPTPPPTEAPKTSQAIEDAPALIQQKIENDYQEAVRLANQEKLDESLEYFKKVVNADTSEMDKQYVVSTLSDAYFNIGFIYMKKELFDLAESALLKANEKYPVHSRAFLSLAIIYAQKGLIGKAWDSYYQAEQIGFTSQDTQIKEIIEKALFPYQDKIITLHYQPVLLRNPKEIIISISGNFMVDEQVLKDIINGLEKYEVLAGAKSMFDKVRVDFIRLSLDSSVALQRWKLQRNAQQIIYWVLIDAKPPANFPMKILIQVADSEAVYDQYMAQKQ